MFSPDGYLGRFGFLWRLAVVNTTGAIVSIAILFAGFAGSGGLALLALFAGVMWCWYAVHARRYADAGESRATPRAAALVIGAGFLACYFVMLSLGGAPAAPLDPFRTGGAIATGRELIAPPFTEIGRWMVDAMGLATTIAVGTGALVGAGILGCASLAFSLVAFAKSPARVWVGPSRLEGDALRSLPPSPGGFGGPAHAPGPMGMPFEPRGGRASVPRSGGEGRSAASLPPGVIRR